ncbi:MAG: hypothetical protein ABIQ88_15625 [Chitinophagaceae bacterium]
MANIETSNFKRLIGVWKTEGTITTEKENLKLTGTDSYEFILDGNYILHKAAVKMGSENSGTFEIIELDNAADSAKMQYFNSKGESGCMVSTLVKNDFVIQGDKIKFEGSINDNNTKISGHWYLQKEIDTWTGFIDLILVKQS